MNKGTMVVLNILAVLAATGKYFQSFGFGQASTRTPQFGMKGHRVPKFKRSAPNGKWVMKCHRGRI